MEEEWENEEKKLICRQNFIYYIACNLGYYIVYSRDWIGRKDLGAVKNLQRVQRSIHHTGRKKNLTIGV